MPVHKVSLPEEADLLLCRAVTLAIEKAFKAEGITSPDAPEVRETLAHITGAILATFPLAERKAFLRQQAATIENCEVEY